VTVVEVSCVESFPFRPSGKGSSNGSLLAKRPLCVTSVAKVLKERFNLIIQQALRPAGAGGGHKASPCNGIAASSGEAIRLCRIVNRQNQAGCAKNQGTRHNPGGGITFANAL
jgi:hypothetical protein